VAEGEFPVVEAQKWFASMRPCAVAQDVRKNKFLEPELRHRVLAVVVSA
jgi:hypothetical protein